MEVDNLGILAEATSRDAAFGVWMGVLPIEVQPKPSQGSWRGSLCYNRLIMCGHVWFTSTPGEINPLLFVRISFYHILSLSLHISLPRP